MKSNSIAKLQLINHNLTGNHIYRLVVDPRDSNGACSASESLGARRSPGGVEGEAGSRRPFEAAAYSTLGTKPSKLSLFCNKSSC